MDRPPLRVVVAVGLVAGCTLALQVLLTRVLSAALFYHFAFFAISLALLGTGAGALAVFLFAERFTGDTRRLLARWSAVTAALLLVVPLVVVRLDFGSAGLTVDRGLVVSLAVAAIVAALPFFTAGVVIALAIRDYVAHVGRVYAFDLAGAGLGAVVVVPLLWTVSAPLLMVSLSALAGAAALLFSPAAGRERALAGLATGLGVAATVLAAATSLVYLPTPFEDSRDAVADRWTPISRVVAYGPLRPGQDGTVFYDRDVAPVIPHRRGEPYRDWRALGLGPQSIAHELKRGGRLLVIGGGGGRDIHNGLSSGMRRIDVIELNRRIREVVDGELGDLSGRPYSFPGVSTAIGDGRSTLAARDTRYDEIHVGFTNTLTAGSGSAYVLSEANLYTREAFGEYLDHLRPGGILSISRLYRFVGDETLRATVLALDTLRRRGARDPGRHVVVLRGRDSLAQDFGTVLVSPTPFTAAQLATVRRLAPQRSLGLVWAPGGPYRGEWAQLNAAGADLDGFCSSYPLDVCPTSDDKPFFLNGARLSTVFDEPPAGAGELTRTPFLVLVVVTAILAALVAVAFVAPLAVRRRALGRPPVRALTFFAAIGLGFLVLEVVLIQRLVLFLGFPTYALSVVLAALLIATGAGAALSARWTDPRRSLTFALAGACAAIALIAFALQPLVEALIGLPFALRVIASVLVVAPVGVLLGTAMPVGLQRLAALHPAGVAWAWGINGITSVLGTVLAVFVAINAGFTAATLVALACYLAALAHVRLGRWGTISTSGGREPLSRSSELASPTVEP